jgi:hypothetical protein
MRNLVANADQPPILASSRQTPHQIPMKNSGNAIGANKRLKMYVTVWFFCLTIGSTDNFAGYP